MGGKMTEAQWHRKSSNAWCPISAAPMGAHIFFCEICLSPARYLCVPLIGDVSCLATKQSGAPIVAMTTWQGYHHHGEHRDERRKEGRTRRERDPCH